MEKLTNGALVTPWQVSSIISVKQSWKLFITNSAAPLTNINRNGKYHEKHIGQKTKLISRFQMIIDSMFINEIPKNIIY